MSKNIKCMLGILIIFLVFNVGLFCNNTIIKENKVQAAVIKDDGFHEITIDGGNTCSHTYSWVTTKNATCTASGSMSYKCTKCGYIYRTNTISALGHNYSSATCTMPQKCTRCGATVGTAMGHDYSAATCTAPRKCTRCGITSGNALGHNYSAATCTTPQKCTRCGITSGNALGHSYSSATCTMPQKCTRCGATVGTAMGHEYKAATCTEPRKCIRCGITSGSALGHQYVYTKIDENSHKITCSKCSYSSEAKHLFQTVSGVEKCKVCGYTKPPEAIKPLCKHDYQWITLTSATCTKTGEMVYKCTICNEINQRKTIAVVAHNYVYTKIDENNHKITCSKCSYSSEAKHSFQTVSGVEKCKACGYTKPIETIPQECKHEYKWFTVMPTTCTRNGEMVYKCTKCNNISQRKTVIAAGHRPGTAATCTKSQTCTICQAVIKPALGHKYAAATCLTPEKCIRCGVTNGKALGHNYKYNKLDAINHEITCSRCDYSSISKHIFKDDRCKICNYVRPTEIIIEPEGGNPSICNHTYAWVTTRRATCKLEGEMSYQCTKCRYISERKITSKIDHIYNQKPIDAEYHIKECAMCGQTIEKEKHVFINGICKCGVKDMESLKICSCGSSENECKIQYSKIDGISTEHIKNVTCKLCTTTVKFYEPHDFSNGMTCSLCNAKFQIAFDTNTVYLIPGESYTLKYFHNSPNNPLITLSSNDKNQIVSFNQTADGINIKVKDGITLQKTEEIKLNVKITINEKSIEKTITIKVLNQDININIAGPSMATVSKEIELIADIAKPSNVNGTIRWEVAGTSGTIRKIADNKIGFTPSKVGDITINVYYKPTTGAELKRSKTIKVEKYMVSDKMPADYMNILLGQNIKLTNVTGLYKVSGNSVILNGNIIEAVEYGISELKDNRGNSYIINVINRTIPIEDIEIIVSNSELFLGDKATFNVSVKPEDATEDYIVYSSNNSKLKIEGNTIIAYGEANAEKLIRAYKVLDNGTKKYYAEKVPTITIKKDTLELNTATLSVNIENGSIAMPINYSKLSDRALKTLKYTVSNEEIISIANNTIILKKLGKTKVTVEADVITSFSNDIIKTRHDLRTFDINVTNYTMVKENSKDKTSIVLQEGKSSKKFMFFIPGTAEFGVSEDDFAKKDGLYYINSGKDYEANVITAIPNNSTYREGPSAQKDMVALNALIGGMEEVLLAQTGYKSLEELAASGQNIEIDVAAHSAGGEYAIKFIEELQHAGVKVNSVTLIEATTLAYIDERKTEEILDNDAALGGKMQVNLIYGNGKGENGGKNTQIGKVTQRIAENLSKDEKYADRVNSSQIKEYSHSYLVGASSDILDELAGVKS